MPSKSLSDRAVASATSKGKAQFEHFDGACNGLLLRVTASGNKTWSLKFKNPVDGKNGARLKIGPYPAISLAAARARARVAQAQIADGLDPRVVRIAPAQKTISDLFADRWALHIQPKLKSANGIKDRFDRCILPLVGDVAVQDFRIDPHYNSVIDPPTLAGHARKAGFLFQDLSALFNFGVRRGAISQNPLARMGRPDKYVPRSRYLRTEEIRFVWRGLPNIVAKAENGIEVLRLCLLLGQRVGEVCGMRKSELDLTSNQPFWLIPAERSKNGHAHVVPLGPLALEIIREAMRNATGDCVFPKRDGKDHVNPQVIARMIKNAFVRGAFGEMAPWTPHDLRRTVATQMRNRKNGLAIPKGDVSFVLNHRSESITSTTDFVYDQNEYTDEKREALAKWDAFLRNLIADDGQVERLLAA